MADILHHISINGTVHEVFEAVSTPQGLDCWWTLTCEASPAAGARYKLDFGPGYEWFAIASKYEPDSEFELKLIDADADWLETRVGFRLTANGDNTSVEFYHLGWPEVNEHYRTSCFCWAMYLRLLKRYVEFGEFVPYQDRLNV